MLTTITIHSLSELDAYARTMAARLKGGEILALSGELGAGKTAFTQALAKALGVDQPLASPTFALERRYAITDSLTLHHYDWYRLDGPEAVSELGVGEVFGQPDAISIVEWPERAPDLIPDSAITLKFNYVDQLTRRISEYS